MKILVCGHTSFASQGLPAALRAAGHEVICFGRGPLAYRGERAEGLPEGANALVTGAIDQLHTNPHLQGPFDGVVNYILLKDQDIAKNEAYSDSLTTFCRDHSVKHLVHISSVSSYKGVSGVITEQTALETDPTRKGSYGSLKVASDLRILQNVPQGTKLSMVRPGFILGRGVVDPIVGTGFRLPWNRLMVLGTANSRFPVITRVALNESVVKILAAPPAEQSESLLLVAPNSPTRREYLGAVARQLGGGTGAAAMPNAAWWTLAVGSEAVARLIGQKKLKPFSKLSGKLQRQKFDASATQKRLGIDFTTDWRAELVRSLDGQEPNFTAPYDPSAPLWAAPAFGGKGVTFIGYGRIVKQKHLPALRSLGFGGAIRAYDLAAKNDEGQEVRAIGAALGPADLFVVATPGPAHVEAIDRLRDVSGAMLVEKPLCYSKAELDAWADFAARRENAAGPAGGGVMVCHNYRYKPNVFRMLEILRQSNPGRLHHVAVDFQSPPVSNDSVAWLRNERRAKTLLLDYSLHFLDVACMFSANPWRLEHARHEINSLKQTSLIEGTLGGDYGVSFLLRQGFAPRRARVRFSFQNYSVSLGFFPDTVATYMAHDNAWLYKQEKKAIARATYRKIFDKLRNKDSDPSHARALAAAGAAGGHRESGAAALSVRGVRPFYDVLFRIADAVYGG